MFGHVSALGGTLANESYGPVGPHIIETLSRSVEFGLESHRWRRIWSAVFRSLSHHHLLEQVFLHMRR